MVFRLRLLRFNPGVFVEIVEAEIVTEVGGGQFDETATLVKTTLMVLCAFLHALLDPVLWYQPRNTEYSSVFPVPSWYMVGTTNHILSTHIPWVEP